MPPPRLLRRLSALRRRSSPLSRLLPALSSPSPCSSVAFASHFTTLQPSLTWISPHQPLSTASCHSAPLHSPCTHASLHVPASHWSSMSITSQLVALRPKCMPCLLLFISAPALSSPRQQHDMATSMGAEAEEEVGDRWANHPLYSLTHSLTPSPVHSFPPLPHHSSPTVPLPFPRPGSGMTWQQAWARRQRRRRVGRATYEKFLLTHSPSCPPPPLPFPAPVPPPFPLPGSNMTWQQAWALRQRRRRQLNAPSALWLLAAPAQFLSLCPPFAILVAVPSLCSSCLPVYGRVADDTAGCTEMAALTTASASHLPFPTSMCVPSPCSLCPPSALLVSPCLSLCPPSALLVSPCALPLLSLSLPVPSLCSPCLSLCPPSARACR
ncbi:unnamed protein product [Closterium sp. NIES-54]